MAIWCRKKQQHRLWYCSTYIFSIVLVLSVNYSKVLFFFCSPENLWAWSICQFDCHLTIWWRVRSTWPNTKLIEDTMRHFFSLDFLRNLKQSHHSQIKCKFYCQLDDTHSIKRSTIYEYSLERTVANEGESKNRIVLKSVNRSKKKRKTNNGCVRTNRRMWFDNSLCVVVRLFILRLKWACNSLVV